MSLVVGEATSRQVPVPVPPGQYEIGPAAARLRLRTYRQGLAAKAGHDLVIQAAGWRGRVIVPPEPGAQPSVVVEVDLRQLEVVEGTGGVKPLTEHDRQEIHRAMQRQLRAGEHPVARFSSSRVVVEGDRAVVAGDLSLGGQVHPLQVEVRLAEDGTVAGTAEVLQTSWGIKPYTGFFGALKLRDAVEVEISVPLGRA